MKIIIVGCGKVGKTLASTLNEEGHDIVVVDTNAELVESVSSSLDIMGVAGNGASYSVQMEAGVEDADLLLAVTTSDELNLLCCLIAKKAGNCHTIARVRNPIYNKEISFIREELGLSMIINPEQAAADEIARLLRFPSAIKSDTFAKGRVELLRVQIPEGSVLHNRKVMEIVSFFMCDVLVCAVERGDEVIIPNGHFVLKSGDKISFIASPKKATDFFKKILLDYNQVESSMIVGGSTIALYLTEKLLASGVDVKIIMPHIPDKKYAFWLGRTYYPELLKARYKLTDNDLDEDMQDYEIFEAIGRKRGFFVSGGEINYERTATMLLDEFRGSKIGRITLELPPIVNDEDDDA